MSIDKVTSQALAPNAVQISNIPDNEITAAKLHTTAIQDKLGYTPVSPTDLSNEVSDINDSLATKQDVIGYTPVSFTDLSDALSIKAPIESPSFNNSISLNGNVIIDSSKFKIPSSSSVPLNPQNGDLYYNTSVSQLYLRTNDLWIGIGNSMPTNGLRFWLPLNGNSTDISGNGLNGSSTSLSYTTGPNGTTNTAALFTSASSLTVNYTVPSTNKTLAFWYKASWNSQTDAFKIGFQGNSDRNGFMFMQGVGSIYDLGFWGYGAAGDYNVGTSYNNIWASNNVWHHIVAVWNGSQSVIYLDGILQTQYFNGSTSSFMNLANTLSGTFSAGAASSNVEISNIAFWDRQLTSSEILSVKNVTGA